MRRDLGDKIRLAWALRDPNWILVLVLIAAAAAALALIWLAMSLKRPELIGPPVTIRGRVESYAIRLGKHSQVGLAQVTAEGRTMYFMLPVNTDCRTGDLMLLSKQRRRGARAKVTPALPHPCQRPTPFSQQ
ncbi:hypothetical protein [Brevundimonas sp. Root1279]|uniref:hypothetical protein n=1 Tax=Brevundimonas sp. Root1279 TaxID=1736443 RepID=UPI0006FDFEFF|nr:hypothetical protein [Brevundimonas sp. Root1279]KQW83978.1 hypothetical protein ASC65_04965 [Brevundimonas sp. Root1279]